MIHPDDHHHDDDDESGEGVEAPEDDAAAPKSTFKVDEIIPIVDSILEQDDKVKGKTCLVSLCLLEINFIFFQNKDGYINWPEFISRQKQR